MLGVHSYTLGGVYAGCTPLYMPSLPYTQVGSPLLYRGALCTVLGVQGCMYTRQCVKTTVIPGVSKRRASRLRKEASFTSGINPFSRGNLSLRAKKPATESVPAQGRRESFNPSKSDLPPPARLGHAYNTRFTVGLIPGPWPPDLVKGVKTVRNPG